MDFDLLIAARRYSQYKLFAAQDTFFRELHFMSENSGLTIGFFDWKDLLTSQFIENSETSIFHLNAENKWINNKSKIFNSIIYDRYFDSARSGVIKGAVKEIITAFNEQGRLFNPGAAGQLCNDKFKTFEILKKKGIRTPESFLCKNNLVLNEDRNDNIMVLKPRYGMKGQGIYIGPLKGENIITERGKINIYDWIKQTHKQYILQPYIESEETGSKSCVIRTIVQKTSEGPKVSSHFARVGIPKIPLNVHTGALVQPLEHRYEDDIIAEIHLFSNNIFRIVQEEVPGLFELGIDIIIDNKKKPWCIEINSKPARLGAKLISSDPNESEEIRKKYSCMRYNSLAYILEYAIETKKRIR